MQGTFFYNLSNFGILLSPDKAYTQYNQPQQPQRTADKACHIHHREAGDNRSKQIRLC